MARRAEQEENHWPGFVDALSTIVMVVTFLLILLVVVIMVLSQQVNPEGGMLEVQDSRVEVASLQQEIVELREAVTEQVEILQEQEQQLEKTQSIVSQQSEEIEEKEQEISELKNLTEQTSISDDGDVVQVQSAAPIAEIEITVQRVDPNVATSNLRSQIETAQAMMTVKYEENAVEMDEDSLQLATDFLQENSVAEGEQKILAMSYFDANSSSVSQAKRMAYYRLMAVRNALLESGIEGSRIEVVVKEATQNSDGTNNVNSVKVFLR
ncbi:MAG TPA: hypothetical protein ENK61_09885 [Devosia sp.]|nr:hypothetical protein [Devosia sp.]